MPPSVTSMTWSLWPTGKTATIASLPPAQIHIVDALPAAAGDAVVISRTALTPKPFSVTLSTNSSRAARSAIAAPPRSPPSPPAASPSSLRLRAPGLGGVSLSSPIWRRALARQASDRRCAPRGRSPRARRIDIEMTWSSPSRRMPRTPTEDAARQTPVHRRPGSGSPCRCGWRAARRRRRCRSRPRSAGRRHPRPRTSSRSCRSRVTSPKSRERVAPDIAVGGREHDGEHRPSSPRPPATA